MEQQHTSEPQTIVAEGWHDVRMEYIIRCPVDVPSVVIDLLVNNRTHVTQVVKPSETLNAVDGHFQISYVNTTSTHFSDGDIIATRLTTPCDAIVQSCKLFSVNREWDNQTTPTLTAGEGLTGGGEIAISYDHTIDLSYDPQPYTLLINQDPDLNNIISFYGTGDDGSQIEAVKLNCATGEVTLNPDMSLDENVIQFWECVHQAFPNLFEGAKLKEQQNAEHNSAWNRAMGIFNNA